MRSLGRSPRAKALFGSAIMGVAFYTSAELLLSLLGPGKTLFITNLFVNLTMVLALQLFIGNTGVVSFGHGSFIALGAYAAGILSLPVAVKTQALPHLPTPWSSMCVGMPVDLLVVPVFVAVVALVVGPPIVRLPGPSAAICTFALLVISQTIFVSAADFTRGTQTFYGVPYATTIEVAVLVAFVGALVSVWFRGSKFGIQLRASAEDETAAAASGIAIGRLRLVAWSLSAGLAGAGGVLYAHMVTSFSPGTFYLTNTLSLLAMLIVGGARTTSGAIVGTFVVTTILELLRNLESGFELGPVHVPQVFGLQLLGLGVFLIVSLILRRDGLFADREFWDERGVASRIGRQAGARFGQLRSFHVR